MESIFLGLSWDGLFTLSLFLLVLILLYLEWRPPYMTMLVGSFVLVLSRVITPLEFIEGFANETLITIAMVCVVVRAVELQGVVNQFTSRLLGGFKSYVLQLLSLIFPVSLISAFFNNTPVVLFLTPVVRQWAIKYGFSPSKFLIPLSYASLMGGLCTLIGTSTNLVVQSMLVKLDPSLEFGFFELAKVGVPLLIVGYLYLIFFGKHLLPDRLDPLAELSKQMREFSVEFMVQSNCPLIGKPLGVKHPFQEANLIAIERKGGTIDAPESDEIIFEGDRLVFAGSIKEVAHLHTIEGLVSQADPLFKLEVTSPHFTEIVIPMSSLWIGKTLKSINFRKNYHASVFAIYRQGKRLSGNVGNIYLRAGDNLMLLSNSYWNPEVGKGSDFLLIHYSQRVPLYDPKKGALALGILGSMVLAAMFGVSIFLASVFCALLAITCQLISLREVRHAVPWTLLLLIVAAVAFGKALQVTGAAKTLAQALIGISGDNPYVLISSILLITIITTELITNNAAVLLIFPLAVEAVQLAGYFSIDAMKTVGVAIAVAGSSGFAMPTGYQTHLIVYGPGGYRFKDFIKIGLPLDVLAWLVATLLIPYFWSVELWRVN